MDCSNYAGTFRLERLLVSIRSFAMQGQVPTWPLQALIDVLEAKTVVAIDVSLDNCIFICVQPGCKLHSSDTWQCAGILYVYRGFSRADGFLLARAGVLHCSEHALDRYRGLFSMPFPVSVAGPETHNHRRALGDARCEHVAPFHKGYMER